VTGQAATRFDLAARQPMIRKMHGMVSGTGDSANRARPGRPDDRVSGLRSRTRCGSAECQGMRDSRPERHRASIRAGGSGGPRLL